LIQINAVRTGLARCNASDLADEAAFKTFIAEVIRLNRRNDYRVHRAALRKVRRAPVG
jgi:hypothetical protein